MANLTGRRRAPERSQFLFDLMVTACEGGIGYWAFLLDYKIWMPGTARSERPVENHEAKLQIYDWYAASVEDGDRDMNDWKTLASMAPGQLLQHHLYDLNIDVMAKGLRRAWAEGWNHPTLALADKTNGRSGDYDAGDADCIVQFGTMGRVVYG
jgi:hypothetical protein